MPLVPARKIAGYLARARFAGKAARTKSRGRSRTYKRSRGLRASTLLKYNVHMYRRFGTPDVLSLPSNTVSSITSYQFTLGAVTGASELTALYDQYQIVGVKMMFQLINNPDANRQMASDANNNTANIFPKIWLCRDYDDSGTETINALQQRNGTKCFILRPNQMIKYYVRPAVRSQLYLDGVTSASSPEWKKWLDCSTSSVPHYGVKVALDTNTVLVPQQYFIRIEYIYYLKFKNSR